jgi:hypothetical protein
LRGWDEAVNSNRLLPPAGHAPLLRQVRPASGGGSAHADQGARLVLRELLSMLLSRIETHGGLIASFQKRLTSLISCTMKEKELQRQET